jgi:CubicO group peptidase (beta-lactamase class C family)
MWSRDWPTGIIARSGVRLTRVFSGRSERVLPYATDPAGDAQTLHDRWSTQTAHDFDPATLIHVYDVVNRERAFRTAYSLLVLRDGELIAEGYFHRRKGSRPTNLKSVTKSVLSLLIGIAIDEGHIANVDARLGDLLPDAVKAVGDPRKGDIGLRDLLTMRAGLQWDEWAHRYRDARRMLRARDSIGNVLHHELIEKPGSLFRYSTGTSQIVAGVLARATGMSPYDFARSRLFAPLGIDHAKWIAARDGIHYGGTHLFLTPRDLMKIGALCAQNGRFGTRQIVSSEWLRQSTQIHAGEDWWEGPYGFHWWVRKKGYCAYGYGGQVLYVVPHANLVVAFTADPTSRSHILLKTIEETILDPCLAAFGGAGNPPDKCP